MHDMYGGRKNHDNNNDTARDLNINLKVKASHGFKVKVIEQQSKPVR